MAWGHPACLVAEPRLETRFCDSQFNVLSYSICLPYKKGTTRRSLLLPGRRNRRQRLVASTPYGFSDYLPNTTPRGRPLPGFKRRRISGCKNPWPHQEIRPYELMRKQFMITYNQVLTEFGAVIDYLNRLSKTLSTAISPKVGKTIVRAQQYHQELFIPQFWNPWGVGLLPQICDPMLNRATPAQASHHSPTISKIYSE